MAKRNYPQNRKSAPRAGTGAGRPAIDGEKVTVKLPVQVIAWLDTQGKRSEVVRQLVQAAMENWKSEIGGK